MNELILLDCTIRDGGYYNNWQYDISLTNKYIKCMEESKVDAIEIGFRSPKDKIKGIFSNVTDDFILQNLYVPSIKYFGVMINTSDYTPSLVKEDFSKCDCSPINLVRVATHFKDISKAESICNELKSLGYTTSVNLMQAADKGFEEIITASETIEKWKTVDILYLADSLGGMSDDSVNYLFEAIKKGWTSLTGYHAHNNKNKALSNTLEAVDIGIDWVDSTISGMGRGPGNAETEYLLLELNKRGFGEFILDPVYKLVLNEFQSLKDIYKWGSSLLYYLAGEYNIHPTFVQTMINKNYKSNDILQCIEKLKSIQSNSFSDKLLEKITGEIKNGL